MEVTGLKARQEAVFDRKRLTTGTVVAVARLIKKRRKVMNMVLHVSGNPV
ncbi:hypothetical protein Csa_017571 [Cucumis sativus]|uniref:Uncharacterized protein n=1 Tax=Cucumis sativus TaxID=3659 RepID=A0A0A0LBJ7_CUCSA|nr:hypothetical protein Csa_017571 [Cucumis sativus]